MADPLVDRERLDLQDTPLNQLLNSLEGKITTDPSGGDPSIRIESNQKPMGYDPLYRYTASMVMGEITRRVPLLNPRENNVVIGTLETCTQMFMGPRYVTGILEIALACGARTEALRNLQLPQA